MIRSFKCQETEKIFNRFYSRKFPNDTQSFILRKLRMLHRAISVQDLKAPPGNRLEELKDGRKGQHSIRINTQWRICFEWHDNEAHNVEILDSH